MSFIPRLDSILIVYFIQHLDRGDGIVELLIRVVLCQQELGVGLVFWRQLFDVLGWQETQEKVALLCTGQTLKLWTAMIIVHCDDSKTTVMVNH